jgi:hypothetical protein
MAAMIGNTTTIQVSDGASAAYSSVPNAFAITVPAPEFQTVEATNLDSGGVRQHISALKEPGEFSFKFRYNETQLDRSLDWRGTALNYKVIFPDSSHLITPGLCTKIEMGEVTPDGVMECTASVKATDIGTLTVA